MPMASGLASTLADFTKKSEFSKNPLAESSNESPSTRLKLIARTRAWLGRLVTSTFVRYLLAISIGVAGTLAWQSYGGPARKTVASWSPRLAWLAPEPTAADASATRLKAASLALTAVRQSVDKLATEMGKLEAQGGSEGSSASSSSRRGSSRRP
jgi:hypothetical protein